MEWIVVITLAAVPVAFIILAGIIRETNREEGMNAEQKGGFQSPVCNTCDQLQISAETVRMVYSNWEKVLRNSPFSLSAGMTVNDCLHSVQKCEAKRKYGVAAAFCYAVEYTLMNHSERGDKRCEQNNPFSDDTCQNRVREKKSAMNTKFLTTPGY